MDLGFRVYRPVRDCHVHSAQVPLVVEAMPGKMRATQKGLSEN